MSKLIDPAEHTGKTRAQRIRLDYHKYRGSIYRWRWIATVAAILIAGFYLAWVGLHPAGQSHLSTGAVSTVHASFEQDCASCHVDFVPIGADAWQIDPATAIKTTAGKCQSCHREVGSHTQSLNDVGQMADQRCAACHNEHRGRDRQLIPTSNKTCIDCHEQTSAFCTSQPNEQPPRNVTQFSLAGHGDFKSLRLPAPASLSAGSESAETPRIEFDHALHMHPGQVIPGRRGGMTLNRLPQTFVEKYQKPGQSVDAAVQLQCADCHVFESSSVGLQRSGDYGWGRSSSPISYNQHCVACHPLTVPGQRTGQWAIPHGVALSSLRDSIAGQLASIESAGGSRAALGESDTFPIRVPGAATDQQRGDPHLSNDFVDTNDREQRTNLVANRISQQCRVCHINTDLESATEFPRLPLPRLRAGRFDHSAHRAVACVTCHPQADPAGQTLSKPQQLALSSWLTQVAAGSGPVGINDAATEPAPALSTRPAASDLDMVLGLASCIACHRDPQSDTIPNSNQEHAILFGGLSDRAPDRCTTCHDYHWMGPAKQSPEPVSELSLITTQVGSPVGTIESRDVSNSFQLISAESRWISSDSCGTSTCHSGPIGRQPNWNSSQSIFEAFDPHARAGLTLGGPWSRRIVQALDPASVDSPERFQQVLRSRCNGCHSPMDADGAILSDSVTVGSGRINELGLSPDSLPALAGVSCEACHGPASDWVQSHLQENWNGSDSMRETQNFVKRIDGCVRCHVGSRRADGMVRDMNHDMIAAGHPALRFEGWSALLRLPRHAPADRSQDGLPQLDSESDLRRFLAAQAIALRAAITLTAERRIDSKSTSLDALSTASVWPELAEFDCFACHHDLKITNFAVRPSYGHPLPHPWLLAGFIEHGLKYLGPSDVDAMQQALATLRLRTAGINQVKPAAFQMEEIIDRYLARLSDPRPLPAEMKSLVALQATVAATPLGKQDANSSIAGDWYQASHEYLRSHVLIKDQRIRSDQREIADKLREMADALQFRHSGRRGNDSVVDSPEAFDMNLFRELSRRLADSVESK